MLQNQVNVMCVATAGLTNVAGVARSRRSNNSATPASLHTSIPVCDAHPPAERRSLEGSEPGILKAGSSRMLAMTDPPVLLRCPRKNPNNRFHELW